MGDRTTVTLYVPSALFDEAVKLLKPLNGTPCQTDPTGYSGLEEIGYMVFDEVNYGELIGLHLLEKAGIPYDSCWDYGSEFGEGTHSCRFTSDGEIQSKEIYDAARNPCLDSIIKLIDEPQALRDYILKHAEHMKVMPWDNQIKYGKLYRTKQLINPD